eukprot:TRINITY_DN2112_c0_g1_i14.p1 TRINITY_DN2112_c0_g1~~TRINITY_DN2112_c0_g1_i14.p1  ORF type:complete len:133 (-),score=14.50 TRINITY_DN2112_c0_g1_i14:91-462(-)
MAIDFALLAPRNAEEEGAKLVSTVGTRNPQEEVPTPLRSVRSQFLLVRATAVAHTTSLFLEMGQRPLEQNKLVVRDHLTLKKKKKKKKKKYSALIPLLRSCGHSRGCSRGCSCGCCCGCGSVC